MFKRIAAVAAFIAVLTCGCSTNKPSSALSGREMPIPLASIARPSQAPEVESPEAFIRRYYGEVNRAIVSGDSRPLLAFSISRCVCRRLAEAIDKISRRHLVSNKPTFVLHSVRSRSGSHGSKVVDISFDIGPQVVRRAGGEVVYRVAGRTSALGIHTLVHDGDGWRIANALGI